MPKILVVDDEEQIRLLLVKFLTKSGFEVCAASGGEEACQLLRSGVAYDLMLLDLSMPKVSGTDVLRLKNELADTRPVILLTGNINKDNAHSDLQALGLTQEDVIYKPIDLFDILALVKKKIERLTLTL